jgi:hypothetical protein
VHEGGGQPLPGVEHARNRRLRRLRTHHDALFLAD